MTVLYWGIEVSKDSVKDVIIRKIKKAAEEVTKKAKNDIEEWNAKAAGTDCGYDALTRWEPAQIDAAGQANNAFYRCMIRRHMANVKSGGLNYARQCTAHYLNKEVERRDN